MCGTRDSVDKSPLTDPGPGYRLLDKGELIQPGDEFHNGFEWFSEKGLHILGKKVVGSEWQTDFPYRRKIEEPAMNEQNTIDPGENFRLMEPHEKVEVGDFYYSNEYKAWHLVYPSDMRVGRQVAFNEGLLFLRYVPIAEPWDDLPIQSTKEIEDANPMVQKLRSMRHGPWPLPGQTQEDWQYDFKKVWNDIVDKLPRHLSDEIRGRYSNDITYHRFEVGVSFNGDSPISFKTTVVTVTFLDGRSVNGVANVHPLDADTFDANRGYRLALYRAALSVVAIHLAYIENYYV